MLNVDLKNSGLNPDEAYNQEKWWISSSHWLQMGKGYHLRQVKEVPSKKAIDKKESFPDALFEIVWWEKSLLMFHLLRHLREKIPRFNSGGELVCGNVVTCTWLQAQLVMIRHMGWGNTYKKAIQASSIHQHMNYKSHGSDGYLVPTLQIRNNIPSPIDILFAPPVYSLLGLRPFAPALPSAYCTIRIAEVAERRKTLM